MTKKEIENHKIAAQKLELIKNKTFNLIKRGLGKISEYDVQKFILSEFRKAKMITLVTDKKYTYEKHPAQIVAVNENSAIPHYFPQKRESKTINKNNLILIDIWARLKGHGSPFADITWVAYSGKNVPKKIKGVFNRVIKARGTALEFIKKNLRNKKLPKAKEVDKITRNYFKKFGLEKNFIHKTGHSLGFRICHGKYFRLGKTSNARIKPNIPFTIEPGLYFKNKFGIRSEVDCYATKDYRLIITTRIQNKIIRI